MGNGSSAHLSGTSQHINDASCTAAIQDIAAFHEGYPFWDNESEDRQGNLLELPARKRMHDDGISLPLPTKSGLASLLCTDRVLKFLVVIFYGILPCGFQDHSRKLHYSYFSLIFVLLQWNSLIMLTHFVVTNWISEHSRLRFSKMTVVLMVANTASITVPYTIVIHYFYSKKNQFIIDDKRDWSVIPYVKQTLQEDFERHEGKAEISPNSKDWFLTNLFLFLGLCSVASLDGLNVAYNMFYGVHGINNFLEKIPWTKQLQYYLCKWTTIFGSGASIVACCIFYAVTRDLIRRIEYTEKAILHRAKNKWDFYFYHRSLHEYTDKVIATSRHWFAVHNLFFITVVFMFVVEWFKLTKHTNMKKKYFYNTLITQIVGSFMVAFKFAFPIVSASRVTSRFTTFYFNIAMNCQIDGIPNLIVLNRNSGFTLYGLRINTTTAVLTLFSCFAGLLKTWYSLA